MTVLGVGGIGSWGLWEEMEPVFLQKRAPRVPVPLLQGRTQQEDCCLQARKSTLTFPDVPGAKTPHSQCRGPRFDPQSGNWSSHTATKSSNAETKDPARLDKDRRCRVQQQPRRSQTNNKCFRKDSPYIRAWILFLGARASTKIDNAVCSNSPATAKQIINVSEKIHPI